MLRKFGFQSCLGLREQVVWVSQWRVLLEGGFGVMESLDWMAEQGGNRRIRTLCAHAADRLRSGAVLEEAFAGAGVGLHADFRAQLRAGRMAGRLAEQLRLVEDLASVRLEMGRRLGTALAYPLTVLLIGGVVTLATLLLVVPRFAELYEQMLDGQPLPWLTATLLRFTEVLQGGGSVGFWLPLLLVALALWALRFSRRASLFAARLLDRVPVLGRWRVCGRSARFCLELSALLGNRLRPADALAQMAEGSNSPAWRDLHQGLLQDRLAGLPLAESLAKKRWLAGEVLALIRVGEAGGQLVPQLQQAGDWSRKRQQETSERIGALAEPVMISVLSLIMGTVALALFLPIVGLIQQMSSGVF